MRSPLLLHVVVCSTAAVLCHAQPVGSPMKFYEDFFAQLMLDSPQLAQLCDPDELHLAHRLGIEYEGERNKFMIGYGFEESARRLVREEGLHYVLTAESLDVDGTALTIRIPQLDLTKRFLFWKRRLVSPVYYHARGWSKYRTRYVEFWMRDTLQVHPVARDELDRFIQQMMDVLEYSEEERQMLAREKIIYVLCRDEEEVGTLTGFRSRGMYLLPFDYVVTTYPCHFHEVAHLLINFKLRRLPLYTHPFLQEGFAAAFGGRGGIAAGTLRQSGAFLVLSSAVDYRELLVAEKFRQYDPSISYAVAGVYVQFLIETLGMDRFLQLYRKYSGSAEQVQRIMLHASDLPDERTWQVYVQHRAAPADVLVEPPPCSPSGRIIEQGDVVLKDCGSFIRVRTKGSFGLAASRPTHVYASRLAEELGLDEGFRGVRFYVVADSQEVVVYDLFTGNSVASYVRGLSPDHRTVPMMNGRYEFWIRRNVMPVNLENVGVVTGMRRDE